MTTPSNAAPSAVAANSGAITSGPAGASNREWGGGSGVGADLTPAAVKRGHVGSNFIDNARAALGAGASEVEWREALAHGVSSRRIDQATADKFLAEGGFTGAPATVGRSASDQKIFEPTIGTPGEQLLARDTTGIPEASLRQIAKDGVAWGRWDQAKADQMLVEAGLTPEARDDRNENEIALDALSAPGKPEDFKIPVGETYSPTPLTEQEIYIQQTSQAWLAAAGFTKETGNAFAEFVSLQGKRLSRMDDAGRASLAARSQAELQKTYGDKYASVSAEVIELLNTVETVRPGLKDMLRTSGLADSAGTFKYLAAQVARNKARAGK